MASFSAIGVAAAESPADAQLARYFVQSACLDRAGAALPGLAPGEPGCARTRPLRVNEALPYRKHDWPAATGGPALGYQASDSLDGTLLGRPAIIQTLDFGSGQRRFGQMDRGDGGQAIILRDGSAAAALTEDGSGGVQWFVAAACREGGPLPSAGWLFVATPVRPEWHERLVHLNIAGAPSDCPARFNPSLTRWRSATIALPWREAATGAVAERPAEVLVSEHFGGTSVATAHHLERFWFARDLGLVRWEGWEHRERGRRPDLERRAAVIAESRRCPRIELSVAPAADWVMADCRTWTNLARTPSTTLEWPAVALR